MQVRDLTAPLLQEQDTEGVVRRLQMIGMDVLASTNLQHLCCELCKVHGLKTEYTVRPGYRELWAKVATLERDLLVRSKSRRLDRHPTA